MSAKLSAKKSENSGSTGYVMVDVTVDIPGSGIPARIGETPFPTRDTAPLGQLHKLANEGRVAEQGLGRFVAPAWAAAFLVWFHPNRRQRTTAACFANRGSQITSGTEQPPTTFKPEAARP